MKEFKRCINCKKLIKRGDLRDLIPYCSMCKAKNLHIKKTKSYKYNGINLQVET